MYKENSSKKKKINPLFLLIILTGFGLLVFKFTKVKEIVADTTQETEVSSCSSDVVDNSYENNSTFLYMDDKGSLTDVTPSTLGVNDTNGGCKIGANTYSGETACLLKENSTNFSLSGWMSDDVEIELTKITAPINLLLGSFNIYNSVNKPTLDNPYFPSAGKVIDAKLVERTTPPGEIHDAVKDGTVDNSLKKQPYSVQYTLTVGNNDSQDTLTIDKNAPNNCEGVCDNESDSNPAVSNSSSKYLGDLDEYPGQSNASTGGSETLHVEGLCKNPDPLDVGVGIPVCWNNFEMLRGNLGWLFPAANWGSCSEGDEGCINSADIAVKISPMFSETNSYTKLRNKHVMDPNSASNYESVYVITSCTANAIVNGIAKSIPVKCIWDMSYLFNLRKSSEFDDVGGSDTPTVEEYKQFLIQESATRAM